MVAQSPAVGDLVRDRFLGLVWRVVDRDDDGTTYIERNNVRSFTSHWNLEPVEPGAQAESPSTAIGHSS
jgi:hypothetical protein